jgi:hypothetical protein
MGDGADPAVAGWFSVPSSQLAVLGFHGLFPPKRFRRTNFLLHIHNFQRRDLSHLTSHSFFIRDNDPIRPDFCIQQFSVLQEDKNNLFVGKVGVNLGKGDDGTVAVGSLHEKTTL